MIKLTQIKRSGDLIECKAFVEDCSEPILLRYSAADMDFETYVLPKGYEHCALHIAMARQYISNNADSLPAEKIILWY